MVCIQNNFAVISIYRKDTQNISIYLLQCLQPFQGRNCHYHGSSPQLVTQPKT